MFMLVHEVLTTLGVAKELLPYHAAGINYYGPGGETLYIHVCLNCE